LYNEEMEYTPLFPESEETEDDDVLEKKDDGKEKRRPNILELLKNNSAESKKAEDTEKPPKTPENKVEKLSPAVEANDPEVEQEATLAPEEAVLVSEQIVSDRIDEVGVELDSAPEHSDAELEATAAAAFLDKIGAKLDNGEALEEDSMDQALAEVAEDLSLETLEEEPEPTQESDANEPLEGPETHTEENEDDGPSTSSVPPIVPPATPQPATSTVPHSGAGGTGGGGLPPNIPPAGVPTPPTTPPSPSVAPRFNQAPTTQESSENSHSHSKYVLGGGIVGYLIGKRRGRIKSEAKLLPIQKKLEKNAEDLHGQLISKEEKLRKMVIANKQKLGRVDRSHVKQRLEAEKQKRAAKLSIIEAVPGNNSPRVDVLVDAEKTQKIESLITHKTESIAPNTEPAAIGDKAEQSIRSPELSPISDKQVIEIAKKVEIGNSKLEDLYRNGRIDIKQMREVVDAYIAGKSIENLIVRHLRPERLEQDPTEASKEQLPEKQDKPEALPQQNIQQIQPDVIPATTPNTQAPPTFQGLDTPKQKQGIPAPMKFGVASILVVIVIASAAMIGLWLIGAL
jgi:hypothetical protein